MLLKVETGSRAYCIFDKVELPHTFEQLPIPKLIYTVKFDAKDENGISEVVSDLTTYPEDYEPVDNIENGRQEDFSEEFNLNKQEHLLVWHDSLSMRHSMEPSNRSMVEYLDSTRVSRVDVSIHLFNRQHSPTHANLVYFFREGEPFLIINTGRVYLCTDDGNTIDSLKL